MPEIESDEQGVVISFPYHDGDLDGVLCEGTTVHLALRSVGGEQRVLTLRGVKHLAIDEFWEGNCVLVIFLAPLSRRCAGTEELERLAPAHWRIEPEGSSAGLLGFVLTSSYGAVVRAICESAEISEPGRTLAVVR